MKQQQQYKKVVILVLFSLAALLRVYGVWYPRWAFDEAENFGGGLNMIKFFTNALGLTNEPYMEELWVYGLVGKYMSILPVAVGFLVEKITQINYPIPIALIFTRFFIASLPSILSVYLLYRISKLIKAPKSFTIILLALCCCTFKHIETAHYAVAESLSTFCLVSSIFYWLKFQVSGYKVVKYLKISTVLVALTASTKINVGMVLGITLAFSTFIPYLRQQFDFHRFLYFVKILIIFFFLPFILLNLPYFIHFFEWWAVIQTHVESYPYIVKGSFVSLFYGDPIFGVDWGIFIVACLGILQAIWRKKDIYTAPILFLLLFYLYLSVSKGVVHRWVIPMSPFLVLLASDFLQDIYLFFKKKINQKANILAITSIILLIGIRPFYHTINYNINLTKKPDTYSLLKQYVADNQIDGAKSLACYIGMHIPKVQTTAPASVTELQESEVKYAIFSDFWFWQRRLPASILNQHFVNGRSKGNWEPIRQYVEQNWHLKQQITPKYWSNWSTNVASPPVFYVYEKEEK